MIGELCPAGIVSGGVAPPADLLSLVGADTSLRKVATTDGGEYAGACPWCGGEDRLRVWPDAARAHYWCRQCGRHGDAIQYLRDRDGLTFVEAARLVGHPDTIRPDTIRRDGIDRSIPPADNPPSGAWQDRARAVAREASAALWSPIGARVLGYLRDQRGLTDATIRAAGLGYVADDVFDPPGQWGLDGKLVYVSAGVLIPYEVGGQLWGLKVRRLDGRDPKYIQPRGSTPALYGADALQGRPVVILTEGEFDALLLQQAAGDLVGVATLGSASQRLSGQWLTRLLSSRRVLVAYDRDIAGAKGAAALAGLSARVRAVAPLDGKDLTEMWRSGGNLRAWTQYQLARHLPAATGVREVAPEAAGPSLRCWWDAAPWDGKIDAAPFRQIVAAYIARYICYQPDLPRRHPEVLVELGFDVPIPTPAVRLPCEGCGGPLPPARWLRCYDCGPLVGAASVGATA